MPLASSSSHDAVTLCSLASHLGLDEAWSGGDSRYDSSKILVAEEDRPWVDTYAGWIGLVGLVLAVVGIFLGFSLLISLFWYPLWTGTPVPNFFWQLHQWLPGWWSPIFDPSTTPASVK